jgi:hypothetical protein
VSENIYVTLINLKSNSHSKNDGTLVWGLVKNGMSGKYLSPPPPPPSARILGKEILINN